MAAGFSSVHLLHHLVLKGLYNFKRLTNRHAQHRPLAVFLGIQLYGGSGDTEMSYSYENEEGKFVPPAVYTEAGGWQCPISLQAVVFSARV